MEQELPDLNIYISFHEDDRRLVRTCVKVLERTIKGGLSGRYNAKFFKTNDVAVGERIGETLDERVESADLVIVLFSYNYRNNKIESQRVYARHKHPIIVMLEDVNKSVAVDPFAAIDVVEGDSFSKVKGKEKTEQEFANRVLNVIGRELIHMNDPSPKLSSEALPSGVLVAPLLDRSELKIFPEIQIFSGHADDVAAVAWSPDGSRIATASADGVRVWNAVTGVELLSLKCRYGSWSVVWSPDGSRIATASADGVRVWDAVTGVELLSLEHDHWVESVAWSPDGSRIATGSDGGVWVWDAVTGRNVLSLECSHEVESVAWSPDGKRILIKTQRNEIRIWDVTSGEQASFFL